MKKMLVVVAHPGDLLIRCCGTVVKHIQEGGQVRVIVLCYGTAGEANRLLNQPGMTVSKANQIRREQMQKLANVLGLESAEIWGIPEYPIIPDRKAINRLAKEFRLYHPEIILTHHNCDPYNPDHGKVLQMVVDAVEIAAAKGIELEGTISGDFIQPDIYSFESSVNETSGFVPDVYIDISDVVQYCETAFSCMEDKRGDGAYMDRRKVAGKNARKFGRHNCKYAEAFRSYYPFAKSGRFPE